MEKMKNKIILGVDLASIKTGWALLERVEVEGKETKYKLIGNGVLETGSPSKLSPTVIDDRITNWVSSIEPPKGENQYFPFIDEVYIEVSTYSFKTASMFSFLAGMMTAAILFRFVGASIHFIEPNVMQKVMLKKLGMEKKITGSTAKKGEDGYHQNTTEYVLADGTTLSSKGKTVKLVYRAFADKHFKKLELLTQDEIDAIAIAILGKETDKIWK